MKKLIGLWLWGACAVAVHAQTLTIKDQASRQPLELVTLYSKTPPATATTDARGRLDLSAFRGADSIYVNLVGYEPFVRSYAQLEQQQFRLYLTPTTVSLDEVVVSGSRWSQNRSETPQRITTVSQQTVTLQNPQTAADLLGLTGEVYIQKSQLGGGSPMIRGFSTNRVLISVDGVRMNNAIFRSGNLQNVISLDAFATEQAEVLFGPGAILYGSDAIGGVMNFRTLMPRLSSSDTLRVSGSATVRYASANQEKTGHAHLNLGLKKWAFLSSATWSDFDDLKMGSRGPEEYLRPEYVQIINGIDSVVKNPDPKVQVPTGYRQFNLMQKVRFKPSENWDFTYGFHYSRTSDVPRFDRLIEYRNKVLRDAEWYYGSQVWLMNTLSITHRGTSRLYDALAVTLAQQRFEESRHNRSYRRTALMHRTETVDAYSANLDLEKDLSERHRLNYGAEVVLNTVGSTGEDENVKTGEHKPGPTRYPDASTWNSYAAYASYRFKASEALLLQAGARYSYVTLDATFDTSFYPLPSTTAELRNGALNGNMGAVWRPSLNWLVNLNLSTGFRAPNVDDIGKVFESAPGLVVVPNPDLKPEYAYHAELDAARSFGKFLKLDASTYYTWLDDALVRRPYLLNGQDSILYDGDRSRVEAIQNAASAYVYGVQAGLEVKQVSGVGLSAHFNYQKGEEELDDGSKAPLRHAPPIFGMVHFTYTRSRLKADLYTVYNGEISNARLAPSEQAKPHLYAQNAEKKPYSPAWYTLNFKAQYNLTDYLLLITGVENITDQRYRPYSSGIVAPGRNYIVALRAQF